MSLSVLIPIEGVRTCRVWRSGYAAPRPISFGFWVKAHRSGPIRLACATAPKTAVPVQLQRQRRRHLEFKTVTLAGDTSGTWLNDHGRSGSDLNVCIAGGSSRVGTAGAWAGSDIQRRHVDDQRRGATTRYVPGDRL
jgi:hypothetical protein